MNINTTLGFESKAENLLHKVYHGDIMKSIVLLRQFMSIKPLSSWFSSHPTLVTVIILGVFLRLLLITVPSLNFDMRNFINYGEIFYEGKRNVYLYIYSYNYSPAIFYIAGILTTLSKTFPFFSYPFLHRTFISLFDVLTLFTLLSIAKKNDISPTKTAIFFFLNPVSILLSGYHAHFDNVAVFFLLFGVWYYFCSNLPYKKIITWFAITTGLIAKHILPFQTLLIYLFMYKGGKSVKGLILFGLTVIVFLATFLPFYNTVESKYVINEYVFKYEGLPTISGITLIINQLCPGCEIGDIKFYTLYKYLFLISGVLFSFFLVRSKDIFRSLLLSILFFIAFTSARSAQYLILPIALGALFPSRWFLIYTGAVTLFLSVFQIEVGISIYIKVLLLNIVWLSAMFWFFSELIKQYPLAKKIYTMFMRKSLSIVRLSYSRLK